MRNRRPFKNTDFIVVDYETTGLERDPGSEVFSYSLTWTKDGYTEVIRDDEADYLPRIVDFWAAPGAAIAHNLKFEYFFTRRHGWKICPLKVLHDTMILHQYVDNIAARHSLDYAAAQYAGDVPEWIEADKAVAQAAEIYGNYKKIPKKLMDVYQRFDGDRTALLFETLWPLIRGSKMEAEYFNEIELVKMTVHMEERGFMLYQPNAQKMISYMKTEYQDALKQADEIAGKKINLNSPKQMAELLFEKLGYPRQKSLDQDGLENLRKHKEHPIFDLILKARTYKTGITTLEKYIDKAKIDGAVHPKINLNGADTGRESSEDPNMQNVSKELKAGVKYTVAARSCFRARPGYFLILGDYAGIEMRLGVQGTKSPRLFELCKQDFDFHSAMATAFYGARFTDPVICIEYMYLTNEENRNEFKKLINKIGREKAYEITYPKMRSALRNRAKTARFAMFYGAGRFRTSETLGLPLDETNIGYEQDKKDFPELYKFMDDCTAFAKQYGFIETFFGRKLRTPEDRPYTATDYCIQGSAAALFKHAQVNVDKFLDKEVGEKFGRCILPVHDELVMEFHRSTLPHIKDILKEVNIRMVNYPEIVVPVSVEYKRSMFTWDKKEDFKL